MTTTKGINMIRQIRQSVFETNSSSTHAINIFRNPCAYVIPKEIIVKPGCFGWEKKTYRSIEDKLSYLYTWCIARTLDWVINKATNRYEERKDYEKLESYQSKIIEKLREVGVEKIHFNDCSNSWTPNGYIDHSEDLAQDDFNQILNEDFINFIFNPKSYIKTGNDNDESAYVHIDRSADYSIFKGN